MATKKTPAAAAKQPKPKGLSDNQRWAYGLILLAIAIFVLVSVVSFFFFWRDDQSVTQWGQIFAASGEEVRNLGGKLGAVTANSIVGEWFGLFGICIPVVLIILALRIMRFKPMFLRKSVRLSLILMILGSIALGYLFDEAWGVFGSGLGGAHGIYVARWLKSVLGLVGTGLLLLLAFIIYAVYINRNTISFINRVGRGLAEGGKKVGETVTDTATHILAHEHARREATNEESQPETPVAEKPTPVAEAAPARPASNWVRDENGFEIHTVGEEQPEEPAVAPTILTDEDGFTIEDRSGTLDRPVSTAPQPVTPPAEVKVDENGFTITDLSPEATTPPASGMYQETDEHGFTIQYAAGDGDPTEASGSSAGFTESAQGSYPAEGDMSSDAGSTMGYESSYERYAEPSPYPESTPDYPGSAPTGYPEPAPDSQFVASVPHSSDMVSTAEMAVQHLPADETLSAEEIENTLYDPTLDLSSYQRPPLELLEDHSVEVSVSSEEIVDNKNRIKETLENFGIKIDKIKATIGPTVTLYEIVPAPGVRISKIKNLEDDIALSLSALGIRIIAPIPGKGTIGIEVPNKDKQVVSMYSVIKSVKFQESTYDIPVVLGKTIQDETFVIDLAKMPHLLVAGATGQGKSVGLNAIITSLLYKKHPSELKLVLVDPKKVELTLYAKLERHFLAKMPGEDDAIITDTHKVIYTLNSLCIEMDARYDLLRLAEVRHVKEYNEKFKNRRLNPQKGHRYLPYIVVIIDEFADLIMTAGREVETPIARLAQLARAVGIHLVIATQRPTTNIITGVIKANFPARIAFRVTSMIDSRTIIDQPGANQLIGRGDMLVSTGNEITRVQCAFVDTPEIERITEFIGNQRGYLGAYELPEYTPEGENGSGAGGNRTNDLSQLDAMFEEVARFVVQNQQGSTSSIQRRFSIGYNRAGRIMDQLEMAGVVGRAEGSKPREVLIQDMLSLEHLLSNLN